MAERVIVIGVYEIQYSIALVVFEQQLLDCVVKGDQGFLAEEEQAGRCAQLEHLLVQVAAHLRQFRLLVHRHADVYLGERLLLEGFDADQDWVYELALGKLLLSVFNALLDLRVDLLQWHALKSLLALLRVAHIIIQELICA